MLNDKSDLAIKIHEIEGLDYYFTEYNPTCEGLSGVVGKDATLKIAKAAKEYRDAKTRLVDALNSAGIGFDAVMEGAIDVEQGKH